MHNNEKESKAKKLSPREEEIVQLSIAGLTNDAIAHKLSLSVGTVNTYWLRIKLKTGGLGRTDTVARLIIERSDKALRAANVERTALAGMLVEREHNLVEAKAAFALFQLAMNQIKSTVWATDRELVIRILANGEVPSTHCGVKWDVGKTVYEIFKTNDPRDLAVDAHLRALAGTESETTLIGEFANMLLRVMPLNGDFGEVLGCISVLNVVGSSLT